MDLAFGPDDEVRFLVARAELLELSARKVVANREPAELTVPAVARLGGRFDEQGLLWRAQIWCPGHWRGSRRSVTRLVRDGPIVVRDDAIR